jgi:hypothetical protein
MSTNCELDHPNGVFTVTVAESRCGTNPFDSPSDSPLSVSPSSSDEELYTHALALQTPIIPAQLVRKQPPPPPPPRANKPSEIGAHDQPLS